MTRKPHDPPAAKPEAPVLDKAEAERIANFIEKHRRLLKKLS